jgi:putative endonuclease
MAYFCYILECVDGSFYTGWTTDPLRRERQHNRGAGGRYTRSHCPVRLVYVEPQPDRSTAMRRELSLKRLTHAKKQALAQKALPAAPVSFPAVPE